MKKKQKFITLGLSLSLLFSTFSVTANAEEKEQSQSSKQTQTAEYEGSKVQFTTLEDLNSKSVTVTQDNKKTNVSYDKIKDTVSINSKIVLTDAKKNSQTVTSQGDMQTASNWKFIHTKYGSTKAMYDNHAILAAVLSTMTPFPANALLAASSVILTTKTKYTYWKMNEWGRMWGNQYQRKAKIWFYKDKKRKKFITSENHYFYDNGGPK
ncbi:hypothetical protein [Bacillus sp. 005/A4HT-01/001]|uniref:hypothetical protein n=1 Tax=Bacillus sp. 005/A4HT-01/001 TaxID=2509010 RepID=UPI001075796E|nr:hypothetical protein [Bacillus sp. 005/A4HT-01/001]TFW45522.1 hypothetical protein ES896_19915 [Bacillus sp. 005/A4HT-01/001]